MSLEYRLSVIQDLSGCWKCNFIIIHIQFDRSRKYVKLKKKIRSNGHRNTKDINCLNLQYKKIDLKKLIRYQS